LALIRFLGSIGAINKADAEGLAASVATSGKREIELAREHLEEEKIASLLAKQLGVSLLDLTAEAILPDALKRVGKELASRYDAMPIRQESGGKLLVAFADPLDTDAIKSLEFAARCKVQVSVAVLTQVRNAIKHHYYFNEELSSMLSNSSLGEGGVEVVESPKNDDAQELLDSGSGADKSSVVRLVQLILMEGLRIGASDIHIEPTETSVVVRYRINGVLEQGVVAPKALQNQVVARIKVMASLDITERRKPQDGALRVRYQERAADVRVSVLPTPIGEKVVLRLLGGEAKGHALTTIGLSERDLAILEREIGRPEGMILISGPTGSGKTSTAHSALKTISGSKLNIVSIENPIEYRLKGITQVEINEKAGLTFAGTLRSILRQDPDVIFVGEIRDTETAKIALQAAQTGHLVLSTVHTIDATASITRLLDLGIDTSLVATSLRLLIAQRLLRKICSACKEPFEVPKVDLARFGEAAKTITASFHGKGCNQCRRTGYSGRIGVFEVIPISGTLRAMLDEGVPETALRNQARVEGARSMRAMALDAVNSGETTVEDVLRVIPSDDTEKTSATQSRGSVKSAPDPEIDVPHRMPPALERSASALRESTARLEQSAPLAVAGLDAEMSAAPRTEYTVLAVDDEPINLELIRLCLRKAPLPIKVLTAESGPAALALLEHETVQLALLDVMMPGMSGIELCQRIRAERRHAAMPVLMITALDDTSSKQGAFTAGSDDYLTKPVNRDELIMRVVRALERTYGATQAPAAPQGERKPEPRALFRDA
jgi:type IV pilus assembly protein PilB